MKACPSDTFPSARLHNLSKQHQPTGGQRLKQLILWRLLLIQTTMLFLFHTACPLELVESLSPSIRWERMYCACHRLSEFRCSWFQTAFGTHCANARHRRREKRGSLVFKASQLSLWYCAPSPCGSFDFSFCPCDGAHSPGAGVPTALA